ncbi:D-aminoacyl-tRNA deacylase [Thorsellia kenyensis]|uniref:D-aminoacyl-tRNA deacylase n=1 Tax=Thorsellia kenyensis TaxID=1549888 RepID=A0ABV6CH61_9GAMM
MIALIQRVRQARVEINNDCVGKINQGILILLGVEASDNKVHADKLLHKILNYRLFSDKAGKMNLCVKDIQGEILVVSQFTLVAQTDKGLRPSFTKGAPPALAEELYDYFVQQAKEQVPTQTGQFAQDMQVFLQNDGPVTFTLQV